MKQLFKDQIPESLREAIGSARFVLLETAPFGAKVLAVGGDPVQVSRRNLPVKYSSPGVPERPHRVRSESGEIWYEVGDLYRIDEREAEPTS
jgi:hypothetical protein